MRTAAITRLRADLTGYLETVKAGEEVVVTDHGRPIALIVPIDPSILADERQSELLAKGLIRPARGKLSPAFFAGVPVPGLAAEQALEALDWARSDD